MLASPAWAACDGGTLVLSCSGGRDSVVLAHAAIHTVRSMLPASRWQIAAPQILLWHLRHGLRDNDNVDAQLVENLGRDWGVAVRIDRVDVRQARLAGKESLESAARRLRYARLDELLDELPDSVAMTAHHASDNAETILFNLVRGTGPAGLRGIAAIHAGRIHRPLLSCSEESMAGYAQQHQLSWAEDSSNTDLHFSRNRIRQRVMPELTIINPAAVDHINRLGRMAADMLLMLNEPAQTILNADYFMQRLPLLLKPTARFGVLRYDALLSCMALDRNLGALSEEIGFAVSADHLSRLRELHAGEIAELHVGDWHFQVLAPGCLAYTHAASTADSSQSGHVIHTELQEVSLTPRQRDRLVGESASGAMRIGNWQRWLLGHSDISLQEPLQWKAWLPCPTGSSYAFRVRREGDRITLPNGVVRKLGDVFTDCHVPVMLRDCWAVLVDESDEPVWLPGICDSRRMHGLDDTNKYLQASIRPLE